MIREKNRITGLILAAGNSTRMGKDKAFLKIKGKYFIQNLVEKLSLVCDEIVIVSGKNHPRMLELINRADMKTEAKITVVQNKQSHLGMFSSLQKGLAESLNSDWVLYHFIDQQNLPLNFYRAFIERVNEKYTWVQPRLKGRNGHPLLLSSHIFNNLLSAEVSRNLRSVSASGDFIKYYWECDNPTILEDIDTPDQYEEFVELNFAEE